MKTFFKIVIGIVLGLLLTAAILWVLASILVFPKRNKQAQETSFKATALAVKSGVTSYWADQIANGCEADCWPKTLDDQEDGACVSCFSSVLDGISNPKWSKEGLIYTYSAGDFNASFTYDPKSGDIQF